MKNDLVSKAPILLAHAMGQHGLDATYQVRFGGSSPLIDVISYRENKLAEYWFVGDVIHEKKFLK
jgi:hypothetical protein